MMGLGHLEPGPSRSLFGFVMLSKETVVFGGGRGIERISLYRSIKPSFLNEHL